MKKLLAIVLALALMMSLSVVAFAEEASKVPSPGKIVVTSDDLPGTTEAVPFVPEEDKIVIIPNGELNEDQKKAVDEAIAKVEEEGLLPIDSFMVIAEENGFIIVEAPEDAIIYFVYDNDHVQKTPVKDLEAVGNGRYKVPVDAGVSSVIVAIAK